MPKDNNITVLEEVSQLLCLFRDFTNVLAFEKQLTLSYPEASLGAQNSKILRDQVEDSTLTKQMKRAIGCIDAVMALAAQEPPDSEPPPATTTQSTSSTTTTTKMAREEPVWIVIANHHFKEEQVSTASGSAMPSTLEKLDSEEKLYLTLPAITAYADPLACWKAHEKEMPRLLKVARKYLCISATSVPSERVFSTHGYILSPQWCRLLSTQNVNTLTFLHYYMNRKDYI